MVNPAQRERSDRVPGTSAEPVCAEGTHYDATTMSTFGRHCVRISGRAQRSLCSLLYPVNHNKILRIFDTPPPAMTHSPQIPTWVGTHRRLNKKRKRHSGAIAASE
jgi:hypothetical protein